MYAEKVTPHEMLDLALTRHRDQIDRSRDEFMKSDKDQDGGVTFKEWFAHKKLNPYFKDFTEEDGKDMFAEEDTDGNGVQTMEELMDNTLEFWKGRAKAWVEKGDSSADGHLDESEFEAFHMEL
jgi:hypothetical protein